MLRNSEIKGTEKIKTTFGKSTVFKGVLRYKNSLKIDGKFDGEIISSGFLYVEKGAVVNADIRVRSIVIGGTIHGNIIAVEKCEMLESGKVYGNIRTTKLRIADGVIFDGKCEMIKAPESIDIFSATVEKLKSTVQSV